MKEKHQDKYPSVERFHKWDNVGVQNNIRIWEKDIIKMDYVFMFFY